MDKQNEQKIVQQFVRLCTDLPNGKLVSGESPDFLLKINRRQAIGIELTELKGQDFLQHTGMLQNPGDIIHHLYDTIEAKEEKLILYRRKKLMQIWLVIHIDALGQVNFRLGNKVGHLNFDSGFDRIFLLVTAPERLYELKLSNS